MNYNSVSNLIWCNPEMTAFNCDVDFETLGLVPFCCSFYDKLPYSVDIWNKAIEGKFGEILSFPEMLTEPNSNTNETFGDIPGEIL